VTVTWIRSG